MIVYLAAVGSDLWPSLENATKGEEKRVIFSFFDMEHSGFQFRRRSWEQITGEEYERRPYDKS